MNLSVGSRWRSAVSEAEVIVIIAPTEELELSCGGVSMASADDPAAQSGSGAEGEGPVLGKRYVDDTSGLQVLCTRPGAGPLAVDGRPLQLHSAKQLPASD